MQSGQILNYKFSGEEFTVVTDKEWFTKHVSELSLFVMDFMEVESEYSVPVVQAHAETSNSLSQIKDILMDNIKKVQDNPSYINQAKSINNNVNTLMNMLKLELQVKKHLK